MNKRLLKLSFFNEARKNKRCVACNRLYFTLEIHHIDKNPTNNNILNLSPICTSCHDLVHNKKLIDKDNPTKKRYIITNLRRKLFMVKNDDD